MRGSTLQIEPARPADVPLLLAMIRELAAYEKALDEVVATEEELADGLFGEPPGAEALVARLGGEPVGFALYFTNFSTWLGRRGLYLEDLYVRPAARGRGVGRALLAALARVATQRGCRRLEWWVLDWNQPAIGFYRSLGARAMDDWTVYRLTGEPLARLAAEAE
jgi:GNAT superfamily N-acetyltransferase